VWGAEGWPTSTPPENLRRFQPAEPDPPSNVVTPPAKLWKPEPHIKGILEGYIGKLSLGLKVKQWHRPKKTRQGKKAGLLYQVTVKNWRLRAGTIEWVDIDYYL